RSVARGLVTHVNTSGLPVDGDTALRLADTGLASVNVSIDHARADLHDAARGREGAFEAALAAVRHLAAARERTGARFRLQVVQAVSRDGLAEVRDLERVARESGADALSILPVHEFPPRPPSAPWRRD